MRGMRSIRLKATSVRVRRADLPRTARTRVTFGLLRFVLYGFVGLASEVIFYTLVRVGRMIPGVELLFRFSWKVDPRLGLDGVWKAPLVALFGQCSLWMFLVYGLAAFFLIERVYRRLYAYPVLLRAAAYGLVILAFEAASGLAFERLTGFKIWYYDDPLNVLGMTSLAIGPIWMVTGLLVELIYRELMDPRVRDAIESELANIEPPPKIGAGPVVG